MKESATTHFSHNFLTGDHHILIKNFQGVLTVELLESAAHHNLWRRNTLRAIHTEWILKKKHKISDFHSKEDSQYFLSWSNKHISKIELGGVFVGRFEK